MQTSNYEQHESKFPWKPHNIRSSRMKPFPGEPFPHLWANDYATITIEMPEPVEEYGSAKPNANQPDLPSPPTVESEHMFQQLKTCRHKNSAKQCDHPQLPLTRQNSSDQMQSRHWWNQS